LKDHEFRHYLRANKTETHLIDESALTGLKFDEQQIAARAHFTNLDALPKTSAAPAILAPLFKLEP
jgi:hypothetical protein